MRFVSTRGRVPAFGFDEVLLRGLAGDGGLFVPERWPSPGPIDPGAGYARAVATVLAPFLDGSVLEPRIGTIADAAYSQFRHPEVAPIIELSRGRQVLELFWGPTLSFKDYALQLVGHMFDAVLTASDRRITVLGATSGDTGSAAIEACRDRAAIDIVILYPHGRVSEVQRRQMTTVTSENVHTIAVDGTFDDCQDIVKAAFSDEHVRSTLNLAAINSINWARVMAQTVYYFWAAARLGPGLNIAVPTGNFGNVLAATVARRMGAGLGRIVIGNNANNGLTRLLESGRMTLGDVVPTLAPAMDIQVPSNLERYLFEIMGRDGALVEALMADARRMGSLDLDEAGAARLRSGIAGAWADDATIEAVIARVHADHGYLIDPHTATAWNAADRVLGDRGAMVVATAHPAKFPEAVLRATGVEVGLPEHLADLFDRSERIQSAKADVASVVAMVRELVG